MNEDCALDNQPVFTTAAGSLAESPDLDWSQLRETLRFLNLAIAQIEASMCHGDDSIGALTDSFVTMADTITSIQGSLKSHAEGADGNINELIGGQCQSLHEKVQQAIIAFQFYDRLVQNLSHISGSLGSLGELIADKERIYNPEAWLALQNSIRSRYTMESERLMFDALMKGATIEEAIELSREETSGQSETHGDIDLF